MDFLVLRPTSGNYTVVGKSGLVTLTGTAVETFTANIPVLSGDILGMWLPNTLEDCAFFVTRPSGGAIFNYVGHYPSDPNINDVVSLPGSSNTADLNESANLVTTPPNMNACKNGGWANYTDSNGTRFKNQGDCVSYVATGGKNPANG